MFRPLGVRFGFEAVAAPGLYETGASQALRGPIHDEAGIKGGASPHSDGAAPRENRVLGDSAALPADYLSPRCRVLRRRLLLRADFTPGLRRDEVGGLGRRVEATTAACVQGPTRR